MTTNFTSGLTIATLIWVLLSGCNTAPNAAQMQSDIRNLEIDVSEKIREYGSAQIVLDATARLRDAYLSYASTFAGDSLSAEYLFQAAMVDADIHNDVRTGIIYLEQIVAEYPDHPITAKTLFLVGFTYAEQLNDYEKARMAYILYLDRYPEGDMAESVRIELANLGMRPTLDFEN
jgi:tetratricopeptide (TPR) repeat protein